MLPLQRGFPGGSVVRHPPANAGDGVQSLGWEEPLKKEMATHSSILAWEIPWIEEPGRLQSTGLQRVRHYLATKQQQQPPQRTLLGHPIYVGSVLLNI